MDWKQLNTELGNIDLYWLDFILKGYLPEQAKILDAGCGEGRNLLYCLKNGMDVFGVDQNPDAIRFLKLIAKQYDLQDLDARFQVMKLEKMLFPDETFDVIICSAVLHFARDSHHFSIMKNEMLRVLKPSGKLFIRTMTDRYLPENMKIVEGNIYEIHENQRRYVLNADDFVEQLRLNNLNLIEPYKEVTVSQKHCMGTFMLQKQ